MKEFLSQNGVRFTERDVSQSPKALAELEELGVMTTPVTVIDREVVIGFDWANLDRLLGSQGDRRTMLHKLFGRWEKEVIIYTQPT